MARLEWHGEQVKDRLRLEAAKRVLAATVFYQSAHRGLLNKSNPRPYKDSSKPGEYPRARTGHLRGSVLYVPTSLAEVAKALRTACGYGKATHYGFFLEFVQRRLGLLETLKRTRSQLAVYAVTGELRATA